jgi:hypothetical protein
MLINWWVRRNPMTKVIDYAIIGGIGTYCAWRLLQRYPQANICLFEYSDRIGGRLLSIKLPSSDVKFELGEMRYFPDKHVLFAELSTLFGIHFKAVRIGTEKDPEGMSNHAYFRGKHLRIGESMESENVYICGEAYSAEQGWCEGALETAELLLTEKLNVEPFIKKDWKPDLMKQSSYRF